MHVSNQGYRPCLVVLSLVDEMEVCDAISAFLDEHRVHRLNVAGNRDCDEMIVSRVLDNVFGRLMHKK